MSPTQEIDITLIKLIDIYKANGDFNKSKISRFLDEYNSGSRYNRLLLSPERILNIVDVLKNNVEFKKEMQSHYYDLEKIKSMIYNIFLSTCERIEID